MTNVDSGYFSKKEFQDGSKTWYCICFEASGDNNREIIIGKFDTEEDMDGAFDNLMIGVVANKEILDFSNSERNSLYKEQMRNLAHEVSSRVLSSEHETCRDYVYGYSSFSNDAQAYSIAFEQSLKFMYEIQDTFKQVCYEQDADKEEFIEFMNAIFDLFETLICNEKSKLNITKERS